jgi:signal peptidase I
MSVCDEPKAIDSTALPEDDTPKRELTIAALARNWLQMAVMTVALFLFLVTFVVQGFAISGSCMEPNLVTGERLLGNKLVYRLYSPARGDVVVFHCPTDPNRMYIKRVIALPGETIEIRDGRVYIDGQKLREPYLVHTPHGFYGPQKVGPDNLFVMGDHRDQSNDSRNWGELPIQNVEAKAWVRFWPPGRLDLMR